MALDPTVAAVPAYVVTMEAERRWLRRRASSDGPSAADYTVEDTRTSLTMGVLSLVVPMATHALVRHVVSGRGRWGRALVGTAAAATAVTTVADALVRRSDRHRATCEGPADPDGTAAPIPSDLPEPSGVARLADDVRRVTGPVAVGTGLLAVASWTSDRTSPARMWAAGGHRRDLGKGVLAWTVAVAGWDAIYYWNHRLSHEVRALWAVHVVHHSSERYNLSTALRQPVADVLGVWVPYGILARLGVRPSLVAQARGINLLYQYWIHTDAIRSLGRAEAVLNTPSHHRVHHGSNRRYLDRNHGSILIVWDRLFRTFQREGEPVVYGLTTNIETFEPVRVATHEHVDMVRDVAASTTWRDRLGFVLRGPGWAARRRGELVAA